MDLNNMFATIRANAEEQVKTCRLIETRIVDAWVMALPTGEVLHTTGIHAFPVAFGDKVERHRDKAVMEARLADVKAANPDNPTVQQLRLMGLKKAARLQRANAEQVLITAKIK